MRTEILFLKTSWLISNSKKKIPTEYNHFNTRFLTGIKIFNRKKIKDHPPREITTPI
jgi:hypothetical protein